MKNNLQKPNSLKPHLRRILHLFRLVGFTAGVIILLALFHLLTIGVPAPLTRQLTARLRQQGIPLHIDSITLSPRRGWILHNPQLYSTSPDNLEPVIQTENLYVHIWPDHWTNLSEIRWKISVYGNDIALSPGYQWESLLPAEHPFQSISRLQAHLLVDKKSLLLDSSDLQWGSILLRAAGRFAFPHKSAQTTSGKETRPAPPSFQAVIQSHAAQIVKVAAETAFQVPPEINLQFTVPPEGFRQASARVTFFASGLQRKDRNYERIGGALSLQKQKLSLDSLQIEGPNNSSLSVFGRWDIPNRNAQINLSNTLSAEDLINLLPEAAVDKLTQTGIQLFGPMEFDASAGPAEPEKLLNQLTLHMNSMQVHRDDLTLAPLRFDLTCSGHELEVKNLKATANGGPLTGTFAINLDSHAWKASAKGHVQPGPIGTLIGGTAQEWIDRFDFTNDFPEISTEISKGEKKGTFQMRSTISGQDFICAGIPFNKIDTTMVYTNHTFSLTPLHVTRANRSFKGNVRLDIPQDLAFFNASSSLDPSVIAQILAPNHPTILTNLTFSGSVSCKASGRIDYSGGTDHAVQGNVRAESVSAAGLTVTSFNSQVEARNDQLIFNHGTAKLFDGNAEGSAVFDLRFNDHQAPYRLDIDLTRMDLNQIVQHFSTNRFNSTTGRLSATLNIAADASDGFWDSATGYGEAEIEQGQLKDLPILGGFSRLIRTTLPGFSLFSLTTLYSKYELHDGALHTENLELGGTLLSAKARGTYSPEKGLDFIVQAEPLRQTRKEKKWYMLHLWFADALKEGTAPLFRLLEFELRGPLNDPKWRLVNLPKEVSEILQTPVKLPSSGKNSSAPETETP